MDVLLRKVGVGARMACVIPDNVFEFSLFVSVAQLRPDITKVNPFFLATFINSELGQKQLIRFNKGSSQPDLHLEEIRKLKVPRLNFEFQNKIGAIILETQAILKESKALYAEAENLLLDELGLRDWSPSDDSISVKSFAESFAETGRLDAEYYQPQYFEIIEKCKSYHLGWSSLRDIVETMTNGVESREFVEEGIPYIRVADIGYLRIDLDKAQKIPFKEASELISKIQLRKDDVITVRSGSIGQAAVIKHEDIKAVLSSHLIRLRIKESVGIKGVYLALFLETLAGNQQIIMQSNGAIVPEISQPSLSRIVVPFLDIVKQEKLETLIELSELSRKKSKQLLEIAKRAVEIAIEDSEETATAWIDAELKSGNI